MKLTIAVLFWLPLRAAAGLVTSALEAAAAILAPRPTPPLFTVLRDDMDADLQQWMEANEAMTEAWRRVSAETYGVRMVRGVG